MNFSNMQSLINFAALCTLFTAPPVLLIGMGHVTTVSVLLLILLLLIVPLVLLKMKRFSHTVAIPFNRIQYLYTWFVWCLFFGIGIVLFSINVGSGTAVSYMLGILVHIASIFILYLLTVGTQWGLVNICAQGNKLKILPTTLIIALYALPVPLLIIGRLLYFDVNRAITTVIQRQAVETSLLILLNFCAYLLIILTMVVVTLYLYPRNENISKKIRYVRIIVTAGVWLAINAHLLYGYIPEWGYAFIYTVLPIFQENILVYISPLIFELIVIFLAVYVGLQLERQLLKHSS